MGRLRNYGGWEMKSVREWLGLCNHKWKEMETISITNNKTNNIIGISIKIKCRRCGKIKFIKDSI